jgi:hypothetical protein
MAFGEPLRDAHGGQPQRRVQLGCIAELHSAPG